MTNYFYFICTILLFCATTSCSQTKGDNFREVADYFLDRPYGASTLEKIGEPLVVRLDSVDCMTFVETVVASRLCGELPDTTAEHFLKTVEKIRYRNGRRNGYISRLHYATDWIDDNVRKGVIADVSENFPSMKGRKKLDFMSTHYRAYPMIMEDTALVDDIARIEKRLSSISFSFIPSKNIESAANELEDGDIIMFMTDIKGLDISHMGFVYFKEGEARLLHASSRYKKVCIDPNTLSEYVRLSSHCIGIRVMRLIFK